ncbi:MAG: hypothetical protein WKG07_32185 [Hymenobacter sp.]
MALVEFTLPTAAAVELRVLNTLGQVVATLRQGLAGTGSAPTAVGARRPGSPASTTCSYSAPASRR